MASSRFSHDVEQKVERVLAKLYDALEIDRPEDLFGSVCIEVRYQNGKPIGQVDVQVKYVMKRKEHRASDEAARQGGIEKAAIRRHRKVTGEG